MSEKVVTNLRLTFPGGHRLAHGKAELMELIAETGSIRSAAARMNMSYRRAWLLVDELNTMFQERSVETRHGGAKGGGAALADFGHALLARFRAMEAASAQAIADDLAWLSQRINPEAGPSGQDKAKG